MAGFRTPRGLMDSRKSLSPAGCLLALVAASSLVSLSMAFKSEEFRYCKDSSFCRRNRAFTGEELATYKLHNFQMQPDNTVTGELLNPIEPNNALSLTVSVFDTGVFRITIDEKNSPTGKKRYRVQDVLVGDPTTRYIKANLVLDNGKARLQSGDRELVLSLAPFPFDAHLEIGGKKVIQINPENLFRFETFRDKGADGALEDRITQDADGLWEESFKAHRDTKPNGPTSVAMDISWPGATNVYGLSERASKFSLPNTRGPGAARDEPYRLYNLDVFEYDVTPDRAHQPLYGAVPLMLSHDKEKSGGLLWLNAAETMVDVEDIVSGDVGKHTHWFSESGIIDMFLMSSNTPAGVQQQYAGLVGTQFMPPVFSLGYHQCRWNYKDEADVREVDRQFDEHDIPYDVLWLDIEHTVGKRYMTWDNHLFPDPVGMQNDLASRGRKMITIIDPHLKADMGYPVYAEAKKQGYFVKDKGGGDFEGHCWPGASSWLDYLSPTVRDYWASRFLSSNYVGSTEHLYTWNDMNEPSVFNGPEITMQKDLMHYQDVEHRDVHNLYGFYMTMATAAGHQMLRPNRRPFILSRAFFAGSQRYAAVWTGDNAASWEHLQAATPMLLQLSMTGIQFCGADVGGFFGNPDTELLIRWYQAAAFTPFFRAHAHIDTKRREPWLFGEVPMQQIRSAIRGRYAVLPYLYTQFHAAHNDGLPILRPLWMEFPEDEKTFAIDDAFLLGSALLVKPVVHAGVTTTDVYLPANPGQRTLWYPFKGGQTSQGKAGVFRSLWSKMKGVGGTAPAGAAYTGGVSVSVDASIGVGVPVFQKGGTVVPARERARRSTAAMAHDPYTLHIALDSNQAAAGELYSDDGDSDNYLKGDYALMAISLSEGKLTSAFKGAGRHTSAKAPQFLERVVVYGVTKAPAAVTAQQAGGAAVGVEFVFDKDAKILILRKPGVDMEAEWTISM